MSDTKVLALYDFASKQEFIYRTSKIREISGASAMLENMFRAFVDLLNDNGFPVTYDLKENFSVEDFEKKSINAEVLYDGGGSLMVLYKSKELYVKANEIISVWMLKNFPTLSLIACSTPYTGNFSEDRKNLYLENAKRKNRYPAGYLSDVTPVSQIDPMTFLPVACKCTTPYEQSLSADRKAKQDAYTANTDDALDKLEGLAAVIYIDGNSMGEKLKKCDAEDYDEGVGKLRSFSAQVRENYVEKPLQKIRETVSDGGFRKVVGGGDEITIICEAEIAWKVVCAYFESLKESSKSESCTSCAGIAIFHGKSPFNVAYEIAEAACKKAKEKAHDDSGDDNNYVNFYYCHAGVTNDFDSLMSSEQSHATGRPYHFADAKKRFADMMPLLQAANRGNVKALGAAAQESFDRYKLEVSRINGYLPKGMTKKFNADEEEMKLVYDMSEFYDIWFSKVEEVKANEENA